MRYKCFLLTISAVCISALAPFTRANAGGNHYTQTNLVSDGWVAAANTDASLKNPWGVAFFPGGPFWVSDNASSPTGVSTLYDGREARSRSP